MSMISDLIILIFDLSLYMRLTPLKKENRLYHGLMCGGVILITLAYVAAAYIFQVPYSVAAFFCMSVPSFLLFLSLSKYKNCRFLVTFCFVDTITLIIAAFAKFSQILGGAAGGVISCIVLLILCSGVFVLVYPYCSRYRELMEQVSTGWAPMAVSTVFIYIMLVFTAAYPRPMVERMEYMPVYAVICITVVSYYIVFLTLILQKAKLTRANLLLQQQRHWHELAFLDELTQLANPAAYAARTQELEKNKPANQYYSLLVFDIDNFKNVNDTYGHLYGNEVLKKTANFFLRHFSEKNYEFFRIGGDEFAAIATNVPRAQLQAKVNEINRMPISQDPGCTYSCGFADVDLSQENGFKNAFCKADQAMYAVKTSKKELES